MTESRHALSVLYDGAAATVVIDRPPVNAVDPALIEEFLTVLPPLAADAGVRCIVIRGTGRFFIAGADIGIMRDLSPANQAAMRRWVDVQRILELAGKPVIAGLNGHALGGGAELSLACDLRIAARSATIGFPEMGLGLFPGAGGSQRLPRLLGQHRAKLIMIEARRFGADEALQFGLVDRVTDDADFDAVLAAEAHRFAAMPTRTIALLKQSMDAGAAVDIETAMSIEWQAVLQVTGTRDAAEGLQSFLDKRPPDFTGQACD
jgi:enoyl-CoA hydratase